MKSIDIQIASDVMCPWCIIGYQNLQAALNELSNEISADISWLPFELNPNMPIEGQAFDEHIQQKYGLTKAQSLENRARIEQMGEAAGFKFNFEGERIMINTFDCHRLLAWAKTQNKQNDLSLAMFKAHFQKGLYLNQTDSLLDTVESAGLDRQKASEILNSDDYADEVKAQINELQALGVSSVPTFIINKKYGITGGQPKQAFVEQLKQISSEQVPE